MSAARLWGGEGTRTRTGGRLPTSVSAPAPHYLHPVFSSEDWWHEASADCIDAPTHIARGGVVAYELSEGPLMFASEPRE